MRLAIVLAGLLAILGAAGALAPTRAVEGDRYPWCAVYGGSMSGSSNCGFTTRQQCLATVSGIGGSCEPNPFYKGSAARARTKKRSGDDQPSVPYYSPSGSSPSYFRD
jgi:hypothetical protein